jgi:RNA polymerase sigma factor (sigma-70 family)
MAVLESTALANAALDELYREHVGDVYRYTYAVLGNHADAEDVTQTTFVNALRALERGERPINPSHWLLVIAHNLVRQRWRQAAARPTLVELQNDVPARGLEDEEQPYHLEELVRALQRIPETQREALVMRELEGRSYSDIATVLGLSTSALETLLFRARRSLADELENVVTCQNAELAISKQLDGRLSRKERRRLDEHLAECPDCSRLAAAESRQRRAFKGLALLPLPIGLALFKGTPSAAAASLPTIGLAAGSGTTGTGAAGATAGSGVTATASATGGTAVGGSLAGGVAAKVAAVVVAATIATGVGYKGVQAVRKAPPKPVPAANQPQQQPPPTGNESRPTVAAAPAQPSAKPQRRATKHATGSRGATAHPAVSATSAPAPTSWAPVPTQTAPAASGGDGVTAAADVTPKPTPAPALQKPVTPPAFTTPKPVKAPVAKTPKPVATPTAPPAAPVDKTSPATSPAPSAPTPPAPVASTTPDAATAPQSDQPQQPVPLQPADQSSGAATSPTEPPSTSTPPSTPDPAQPPSSGSSSPPATTPPPTTPPTPPIDQPGGSSGSGSTADDPSGHGSGDPWSHGEKRGHHKGNHDGRHPGDS